MKRKLLAAKTVLSFFLLLAIFLIMPFILIERVPISASVSDVFCNTDVHELAPSGTVKALRGTNGDAMLPGYIFLPPDAGQAEKKTSVTIRGVNGIPKVKYSEEDLYWLSRIIYAEAGTEPFEGMIAVGSVVMNRVASDSYPDTVYGVIFDKKFGVQFTPAATGTVYRTPSKDAITAAKICLAGYSVSEEILFFLNERIATCTWTRDNCQYVMTIGNHDFYA